MYDEDQLVLDWDDEPEQNEIPKVESMNDITKDVEISKGDNESVVSQITTEEFTEALQPDPITIIDNSNENTDSFDPAKAAARLTEKQNEEPKEKRTGILRQTKESNLNNEDPVTTADLARLYEYVEEQDERMHPAENLKFATDIFGNVVNPKEKKESIHQYGTQIVAPNQYDHMKNEEGHLDFSIGAQEAHEVAPIEEASDPTSEHFATCVTRECPIKENCLRYRLKNRKDTKVPFYPEECAQGKGGYLPLSKFPEFTAYDPLDSDNIRTMPQI